MSNAADQSDREWHLDKRLPIALIMTIVLQTVGLVTYVVSNNVSVEYRLQALEKTDEQVAQVPTDIALVKQEIRSIRGDVEDNTEQLDRIEDKIDKLNSPN